jgi:hypothetical protein
MSQIPKSRGSRYRVSERTIARRRDCPTQPVMVVYGCSMQAFCRQFLGCSLIIGLVRDRVVPKGQNRQPLVEFVMVLHRKGGCLDPLDAGICSGDVREGIGVLEPDLGRGLSGYDDSAVIQEQSGRGELAGGVQVI